MSLPTLRILAAGTVLFIAAAALSAQDQRGVAITPADDDTFAYADDFTEPLFLRDALTENLDLSCWSSGTIASTGPHRNRTLIYRFYADRPIADISVSLEQRANSAHLGGNNYLYISANGLDWTLADRATNHPADERRWHTVPLTVGPEAAAVCIGAKECYLRIVLDNTSGLRTGVSSAISALNVEITLAEEAAAPEAAVDAVRRSFAELYAQANGRVALLDGAVPLDNLPPHYYEEADGYLVAPTASALLRTTQDDALLIHRDYTPSQRTGLSLTSFIQVENPGRPLALQLNVAANRQSCRQLQVFWDDALVAEFDTGAFFTQEQQFYVRLPAAVVAGPLHRLRIVPQDGGPVYLRRLVLAGPAQPSFVAQPAPPSVPSPKVLAATYEPDPAPPAESQAVEGRDANWRGVHLPHMQTLYERNDQFGALRICLHNPSDRPVRVRRLLLNGAPIEDHYVDFTASAWDARGVVWYRVRPMTIPPAGSAEAYVRFRRRPSGNAADVAIEFVNADPLHLTLPYTSPQAAIDYVTTDAARRRLYVYVRRLADQAAAPATLALNGVELTQAILHGGDYPGAIALFTADLGEPLAPRSHNIVSVTHADGDRTAAQFRQVPFFFPRSSIHTPASLCPEVGMNLAPWHTRPLEECQRYDIYTTAMHGRVFDLHERVAYVFGPDEPDAHDNRGGGYDVGLGAWARTLRESAWQELLERYAPHTVTWLIMNGTTRPLNWAVYGQLADISCFDPYPVTYYGADHAYVRESLEVARVAGAPRRMFACLEAYGWARGQGVPSRARGPVPQEYRQNIVQAIGAGMKGLTSWVYSANAGGWQGREDFIAEITASNRILELIENYLLIATPVDLVTTDSELVLTGRVDEEHFLKPQVAAAALLAGPDAMVVTAANHIPASQSPPEDITPAENITLTISLPDYFPTALAAYEATPEGLVRQDISVDVAARTAVLRLDQVVSGRVFVIR